MPEQHIQADLWSVVGQDWHQAIIEVTQRVGSAETIGVVTALAGGDLETDLQAFDYLNATHPEAMPLLMDRFHEIGEERRAKELKVINSFRFKLRTFLGLRTEI